MQPDEQSLTDFNDFEMDDEKSEEIDLICKNVSDRQ